MQLCRPIIPTKLPSYLNESYDYYTVYHRGEWCMNCENETLISGDFEGQRECVTCGAYFGGECCVLGYEEEETEEYKKEVDYILKRFMAKMER